VQGVLQAGGFDGLETTEAGLREGVFFERLLASGTARALGALGSPTPGEPLFADVRRASVLNLAGQYHLDVAHTRHVAALALGMFDELARLGLHEGDARERELLWAASILHDVGMSVDYDDHHKHSRYLILNAGLPGFTPVEVAIIAQAARYHRKGMPDPGPLRALFGEGDAARLDRCAVLLRLAEDLERSRDQLVRGTQIELRENEVELRLIADGESIVPRWAARRETGLFARAFDHELAVAA
jgi:exopolyphosphatase/guanosine-5'-triphosphate,3'-diphosphate pyrophosphatase